MPPRKLYFAVALTALLILGFIATSIISYFIAHDSLASQITEETLPLTSDNIYSEIEQDLLRSILISSLMAHDTFVRDWTLGGEEDERRIIRYLRQIKHEYDTTTAFFVSDRTRRYYHPRGVLRVVDPEEPGDEWYFRVREMRSPYEINIDTDTADPGRINIFVNYRVLDYDNRYLGATGVGLSVDSVGQLIDSYQRRYDREIYFINRDGDITLRGGREGDSTRIQDRPGMRAAATRILTSPSATLHYTNADGRKVYVNSRLIPEFDWILVVEQAESSAEARIFNALLMNIGVALTIMLLVMLTGWFTVRGYQERLEQMATTDKVTGATNRQVFDTLFDHVTKVSARNGAPVSLIAIDIDRFKQINDRHGHAAGDAVLRMLVAVVHDNIRSTDTLCRWGGDEFLVLLGDCDRRPAREVAEKICHDMRGRSVRHHGTEIRITISLGVTEYRHGETLHDLVGRCDTALYEAKRQGRDGIAVA